MDSELEKRLYHLKTLFDASQEVGGLRDSREILNHLLLNAIGGFGSVKGIVFFHDSGPGGAETVLGRGFDDASESGGGDVPQTEQIKELLGNDFVPSPAALSTLGISLFAPLRVSDEVKGGIGLGERITGEPYTESDRELLGTLAAHGEAALRNVRLLQQLERRVFHLKTLYDLSQDIGYLQDPREILPHLLMMAMGNFGAECGVIVLLDANGEKATSHKGLDDDAAARLDRALDSIRSAEVLSTLLPVLNMKAWIPFTVDESLAGGMGLGEKLAGDAYSPDDLELLQTLAAQGAVAVENAKLLDRAKKEEVVRVNLSRYLSPQIVDRIVKHDVQVDLGGDRKVVTVLFSDIRNFTTITESRPPDQLITILNEYFTSMAEAIFEQQGSLDKYIGDAIVAVFGSLVPVENPARNAVAAAVAMMNRLPELNRRWEERFCFSMNIGIGVNTGEVFLGNIGSPERMEFTVIGDAVNVASRFSGLAKAGQVLVTKETLKHLGTDFRIREHPPAEVKGKSGKLEVFEVLYTRSSPRDIGPPPVM